MKFVDVNDVQNQLEKTGYISSKEIATIVFLAKAAHKPVLVEGPAGSGKTELAKAVARALDCELIRLQCYEGLDEAKALYEWEYSKQLLYTQMVKEKISDIIAEAATLPEAVDKIAAQESAFFSERFIQPRPLLRAISYPGQVVLLVDEVDKSDPEFEAFLLELLSDFQVSIPELGTVNAEHIPFVILTSNNSREISDALKRRCIYLYIDYPDPELEKKIILSKFPEIQSELLESIVSTIESIRELDLKKRPSVSETLDWAQTLILLQVDDLQPSIISSTLSMICKTRADAEKVREALTGNKIRLRCCRG